MKPVAFLSSIITALTNTARVDGGGDRMLAPDGSEHEGEIRFTPNATCDGRVLSIEVS